MTQLLQTAIEEALKQPPEVQNSIATAILGHIAKARKTPRPLGIARGKGKVADNFNAPLPDEELDLWYERQEGDPLL